MDVALGSAQKQRENENLWNIEALYMIKVFYL